MYSWVIHYFDIHSIFTHEQQIHAKQLPPVQIRWVFCHPQDVPLRLASNGIHHLGSSNGGLYSGGLYSGYIYVYIYMYIYIYLYAPSKSYLTDSDFKWVNHGKTIIILLNWGCHMFNQPYMEVSIGFLEWGYPEIIHFSIGFSILTRLFHEININKPAMGIPHFPSRNPMTTSPWVAAKNPSGSRCGAIQASTELLSWETGHGFGSGNGLGMARYG